MRLKRQPRPRSRLNAALLCLLLVCMLSQAAPALGEQQWIALDPELHRQGDRSSIDRQGPWVQFTQSWGELKSGKPGENAMVERMAVNCLTGAYGQTQYPLTDPKFNRPILKQHSLSEVEHAQDYDGRLLLSHNSTALGGALMEFACTCQGNAAGLMPTESEIHSTYDRYMAEPLSKVEFHLRLLRVRSEKLAMDAIAELAAGKPFETVFDEYSSAFDAKTFPHGDLGPHLETEFPIADVRLYRQLNVGEFSRTPHEDLFGWEVDKLESKRTIPAPTLPAMRPRLQEYLMLAHSCGWTP